MKETNYYYSKGASEGDEGQLGVQDLYWVYSTKYNWNILAQI